MVSVRVQEAGYKPDCVSGLSMAGATVPPPGHGESIPPSSQVPPAQLGAAMHTGSF